MVQLYIERNQECLIAMSLLKEVSEMRVWLDRFSELYKAVTITGNDLPNIPNCNYNGILYEHIVTFHTTYTTLLEKEGE